MGQNRARKKEATNSLIVLGGVNCRSKRGGKEHKEWCNFGKQGDPVSTNLKSRLNKGRPANSERGRGDKIALFGESQGLGGEVQYPMVGGSASGHEERASRTCPFQQKNVDSEKKKMLL